MRNASGHQGENKRQWKKSAQEHIQYFPSCSTIKNVTRKFLEVSRYSRSSANKCRKKCVARAKTYSFFAVFAAVAAYMILFFGLSKLYLMLTRASLLALAKSMYRNTYYATLATWSRLISSISYYNFNIAPPNSNTALIRVNTKSQFFYGNKKFLR